MTDTVEDKVRAIIADQAMVDEADISIDTSMEELGLDSLSLVEVVFAIEEEFDVSVPFNANDPAASDFDLSTFGKVVIGVRKLISEKEQA